MVEKRCTWCGKRYEAKTVRSKYCSDSCKMRAFDERHRAADEGREPVFPSGAMSPLGNRKYAQTRAVVPDGELKEPGGPVFALPRSSVLAKVSEALKDAPDGWKREMALTVAERLDHAETDSATSVANLSQQLDHLMSELDPNNGNHGDELDELERRVASRRGARRAS